VEEQFYLVWPWLNRWIGRLGMLAVCVLLMLTCPLLRWLAAVHVLHTGEPGSKTWMIADNLAIGALLALVARTPRVTRKQFGAIGTMFLVAGAAGIMWMLKTGGIYEPLGRSVGLSCFMLFGAGMVTWAVCWYRIRPVPKVFSFLLFFGHISYGLYLIHMFCLALYDRAFGTAWQHDFKKLLLRFLVGYSIAIALAWLSRETYEKWFLRRGRRRPAGEVGARSATFTT
jgi:peptidoglycan/LPS O-acetylase OafA/YrhL